ncbi:bombyxin F-1-like [Vanessa atalanta]|uniref:bombyxin F-1-like n=1 Tax=Vanessa atalanta TaxID=42275 RepID=UPI001FCE22A8|nr:bombyxin F-1-like [Vanessa atalanta]
MKVICESSMTILITLMGYIWMGDAFNRTDLFNQCGPDLNEAVSFLCHGERRSSSINENSGLDSRTRRQIADECCLNNCTVGHVLDFYCKYN